MSNPFHKSLAQFRGRRVRATSNDGVVYRGWVERLHHHDRHVVLRDATRVDDDRVVDVGAVMVAHVDGLEILDSDSRIQRVPVDDLEPSPFATAEFDLAGNRQYVDDVRQTEFVGSYPTVRELDDGTLEIVEGHKRIWALQEAGVRSHPVEIVDVDDWQATRKFVADHLPDKRFVQGDGSTSDGWYNTSEIEAAVEALLEEWGECALDLERVEYNAARLSIDPDGVVEDEPDPVETTDVEEASEDLDEDATTVDSDDEGGESSDKYQVEGFGTYDVRSYGLPLGGNIPDHLDAERATVYSTDYGADLVPGTDAAGPDYSVGADQVLIGNPGQDAIGVDDGDEVRALPDGDVIRLEIVSDEPDNDTDTGANPGVDEDSASDVDDSPKPTQGEDVVDDRGSDRWTSDVDPSDHNGLELSRSNQHDGGAAYTCQNCGNHVTERYVKVFVPDDVEQPRACPECPDKIREGDGTIRDKRYGRSQEEVADS